ncbi:hypothetical protein [Corynebacterium evansiae]|uniref:Secreted protein n=1 Tax=Corynebacterium evansiae TaxID=2913499 RepID=A0A9X3LKP5_9CORY|nr:hypothetical protein [Corynebacterium evansiae]MCZ9288805.1 hypothetical protein [Corynebacterium evansiae]
MKLKKSLLALTTAATVAVAGSTAAVAEDNDANGSKTPTITAGSLTKKKDQAEDGDQKEPGKNDDGKKKPSKLAGSAANFFGWDEGTKGLDKFKDVTALVTAVGALLAGIITLANNFQKLGKLAK